MKVKKLLVYTLYARLFSTHLHNHLKSRLKSCWTAILDKHRLAQKLQPVGIIILQERPVMLKRTALIIISFLIIVSLACSQSIFVDPSPTVGNVNLLFQDDFSDPSSGWLTERDEDHIIDYENGGFRIWGNRSQFDYWSIPSLNFTDVRIEVDAVKLGGPDNNSFGVICRYNQENFYGFIISSDGYYGISKRKNGDHQIIGAEGMKTNPVIKTGAATNHIQADCVGNVLTLYVNGEKLQEVIDNEFTQGDVGLLAGSFDVGGIDIRFNRFQVLKP
jgi:hypothetical protein